MGHPWLLASVIDRRRLGFRILLDGVIKYDTCVGSGWLPDCAAGIVEGLSITIHYVASYTSVALIIEAYC